MARYFFHVHDGKDFEDLQGTELPDIRAARREAVRFACALLADDAGEFWDHGEWKLRVTDDRQLTLFELLFISIEAPATAPSLKV